MENRDDLPHAVEEVEHLWIPLPDGCRLGARLWLPAGARERPVPAIVEYIPYRKRDGTRIRDEPMHRYFAGHGYAALRIDLRGSGESDGLLLDEYLPQEQDDGVAALSWLAAQPFCDGRIGMIGKSWGGFSALQIAARAPEPLRAVIAVCATDDRYADDAHYMGGCLLLENVLWGAALFTLAAQPPDPALVGEGWRDTWLQRLDATPLYVETWLRHPRRDAYWKHGSVAEEFEKIRCPVFAVSGWADGYTNAVGRLLAGLSVPRRGLIGPWAHVYPHEGVPGPAIGFLQEALGFFDRWVRGREATSGGEPALRAWMQESLPPGPFHAERPGRWVAEDAWPSPRIWPGRGARPRVLHLAGGRLRDEPFDAPAQRIRSPLVVGLDAGSWCGFGLEGEMPGDQRADDGRSVVFDSAPLVERLEILGAPVLELSIDADRPLGLLAARLNDVSFDGTSERVTYGLLNLAHRDGHDAPRPLVPGERVSVRLQLSDAGHAFPAGHRIRVALSTAYWPVAWPSPERVTVRLFADGSRLLLPVRPASAGDADLRPFPPPEAATPASATDVDPGGVERVVERDLKTRETVYRQTIDEQPDGSPSLTRLDDIDLEIGHAIREEFRIVEGDPLSARAEVVHRTVSRRGAWSARVETTTRLSCDRETFLLNADLRALEGDDVVFERRFEVRVPRDHI